MKVKVMGVTGLAAVAIALSACGRSAEALSPTALASAAAPQRIVVLGDSLSISPSLDTSFPVALEERAHAEGLAWTVVNAGVKGDTSARGLARLNTVLADPAGTLVVALGANDGLRGLDLEALASNLGAIIERAQARQMKVLLCGMETPPLHGFEYTLAFHRIYPDLARRYGVPLVPFLLDGVALNPEMNGDDLIHPNAAGARRIAATVWPYLAELVAGP